MAEENASKAPAAAGREPRTIAKMAPLLSRRSVIFMSIGLLLGIGLGLGYWVMSPSLSDYFAEARQEAAEVGAMEADGPHQSTVHVEIVSPGSSYVSVKELQRRGEYYAVKAGTFPFLKYLSQELTEEVPEYAYTAEELRDRLRIRYDWDYPADMPAMEITVTGEGSEETRYLSSFVPHVFLGFLMEQEAQVAAESKQQLLREIDTVTVAVVEAETELAGIRVQATGEDLANDAEYLALEAQLSALEIELGQRVAEMANIIAEGTGGKEYTAALGAIDRTSKALSEARSRLNEMEAGASVGHLEEDLDYLAARTKVDSLNRRLSTLTSQLTGSLVEGQPSGIALDYLAVLQPSPPTPVPPERIRGRNAVMMGAILGLGLAWAVLNRRWVGSTFASLRGVEIEDDGDDA